MTRLNLLIINDNHIDNEAMTTFLASLGHAVATFTDINEALEQIATTKPELVFVSEKLNSSNAQDFIIKASQKKVFTHSAFLLMTEHSPDENTKIKYMSLGFSYFTLEKLSEKNQADIAFCLNEEINLIKMLRAA
jgi:response regulator RpfG family c-di-GMP phosphodiesterase